jgi:uncharacterized membrane protein YeiH
MTYYLGMLAMAVFAVTGVVAGGKKDMDIFTIVILGVVTAIGGGTLRDIILDVNPIYWIADLTYLWVATGASIAAFFLAPQVNKAFRLLEYSDGLGVAMFSVLATEKTLLLGFSGPVAVLMGMITGISGGMLRDIMTARMPLLFGRELYATPVIFGCTFYVLFNGWSGYNEIVQISAIIIIFIFRAAAIRWQLYYPGWLTYPINR